MVFEFWSWVTTSPGPQPRMLADFGAQVIKVERVVDRGMGSPVMGEVDDPHEHVELCGTVEICNRWINGAVHYVRCSGDV